MDYKGGGLLESMDYKGGGLLESMDYKGGGLLESIDLLRRWTIREYRLIREVDY